MRVLALGEAFLYRTKIASMYSLFHRGLISNPPLKSWYPVTPIMSQRSPVKHYPGNIFYEAIRMNALSLTKEKGERYSITSHEEGDVVMMTKKWRRKWEAFGGKLTFIIAPPIILLIKLIPLSGVYLLGTVFARIAVLFSGRRKKIALANLRLVFGNRKGAEEIDAIYRECLTRTITSFLESMKFCLLPPPVAKGLIEIVGKEHLDAALNRGKGIIIAGLHLGNFPLLAAKLALEGYPIAVIIKKPRNKYIAQLYTSMTDTVGVGFIDGGERRLAATQSLRQLRGGGVVYVMR